MRGPVAGLSEQAGTGQEEEEGASRWREQREWPQWRVVGLTRRLWQRGQWRRGSMDAMEGPELFKTLYL